MSNKVYKFLKRLATLVMPTALATYLVMASTWHTAYSGPFAAVIAVTNVLLTVLLLLFDEKFETEDEYSGEIATVGNDPDTGLPELKVTFTSDPFEFVDRTKIVLKSVDMR